jgi:dihydropteroate synthase
MRIMARRRRGVALVGVCNVTPDSFSDGGHHLSFDAACRRIDELVREGADMVDIGAESTRPGALPVPASEQLSRMLEVVRYAATQTCVSVDTTLPEVAEACLGAGAVAVNDVSCLEDPRLAEVAAVHEAILIVMHARGAQAKMHGFSVYPDSGYGDVLEDVLSEWGRAADRAVSRGLPRSALVMDPGFGFSKNAQQSLLLLKRTGELVKRLDVPVMVGASRKSFLRVVDPEAQPTERLGASVAAAVHAVRAGAALVRVHDVRATRQAIDLFDLTLFAPGAPDARDVPEATTPASYASGPFEGAGDGDRGSAKAARSPS